MISEFLVWLILFAPLASFVVIGFVIWPLAYARSRSNPDQGLDVLGKSAGWLTILAIAVSFVISVAALFSTISNDGQIAYESHKWLSVGDFTFNVGILMDPLTAVMLVVVTGVSLMVQIYSLGYMSEEENRGFSRYYAYMSLFTTSMVGLVLASNIIQVFVFWELVGLCSYLLIGFWFTRPSAANAAKKAFIVTRVGDFGFLLAIMYLFFQQDTLSFAGLNGLDIT